MIALAKSDAPSTMPTLSHVVRGSEAMALLGMLEQRRKPVLFVAASDQEAIGVMQGLVLAAMV